MDTILHDIASRYSLKRRSGRWVGPCPQCGGSSKSDKFNMRDDGGFKCYSCEFKGDIITWLRQMENMSCAQAHETADRECRATSCGVYTTCRAGGGDGTTKTHRPRSVRPATRATKADLPETEIKPPQQLWLDWATDLHVKAVSRIFDQQDTLAWLAARGIDREAVSKSRLGWLPHHHKVPRDRIGLAPREDGKKTLWVPDGLLIPTLEENETIHRLRVRRTSSSRAKFLPDLKYLWLEGSGTAPMVIQPEGMYRGMVVVEAELDGIAVAAAHPDVLVVALGTVAAGLPDQIKKQAHAAPVILVALDADPGENKKGGAGPKAIAAWRGSFRQARYWPVPVGKDPGDYAEQGGDLHAWIAAGLPPSPKISPGAPARHDQPVSPGCYPTGAGGDDNTATTCRAATMTLPDGQVIHIVESRAEWEKLVDAGEVVFSRNEMERLQVATATMTGPERLAAALQVVETKKTFGHAWIRRGEAL